MTRTAFRICPLCEATCGLRIELDGDRILSVRGDEDDVLSRGYVCPKGVALAEVHNDSDRLRRPVRRTRSGGFEPISWEEAFETTVARLSAIRQQHGSNAVAVYYGNPTVYDHGAILFVSSFLDTLGTRNRFSSNSQDVNPRLAVSYLLYGATWSVPIPDVDRTQYFLCIGANPVVSNGSLLTAPNMRGRIRGIRARGGKVVVVDPRRSETAREADEHVSIRPGADAALLLGMVALLAKARRVDRERLATTTHGWTEIERRLADFPLERAARFSGVPPETIERLAFEFADAPSATAYSRMGVCVSRFGTAATYATDLLNIAAGRLGRVGGAMFATPAADISQLVRLAGLDGLGRWRSRVRGLPETLGDLPTSVLAEEIETAGTGQVRAVVTFAGNPVLSAPNGRRLAAALDTVEFMASIDLYVNETTRHADVILPPSWALTHDHMEVLFPPVSIRNVARYSPAVLGRGPDERADWEILRELTERLGGGPTATPWVDRLLLRFGRYVGFRWEPTLLATLLLRLGPHGDRFLPWSRGLNRKKLEAAPHGIDLGPLEPGVERRVCHRDRRVHLDAPLLLEAVYEVARALHCAQDTEKLVLIGRREQRTNNSWMHNLPSLVSGRERCLLMVHPDDAERLGIADGELAVLESRVYRGEVRVQVTDEIRRGVVSLPHGWGHAESATWQRVAGAHPGVSANDWTDDQLVESAVGQSILNGVPVHLARKRSAEAR
jgi:anaerobic selenocysteine-containing dehydrogenase